MVQGLEGVFHTSTPCSLRENLSAGVHDSKQWGGCYHAHYSPLDGHADDLDQAQGMEYPRTVLTEG
jgi:hypothetical protein